MRKGTKPTIANPTEILKSAGFNPNAFNHPDTAAAALLSGLGEENTHETDDNLPPNAKAPLRQRIRNSAGGCVERILGKQGEKDGDKVPGGLALG